MYPLLTIEDRHDLFYETEVGMLSGASSIKDSPFYKSLAYPKGVPERDLDRVNRMKVRHIVKRLVGSKIKVRVVSDQRNCTDGKTIWISGNFLKDRSHSPAYLADAQLGVTVHECAHVLYTDFERAIEYMKTLSGRKLSLTKHIQNLIEDIRIEKNIKEHKSFYYEYLKVLNNYFQFQTNNVFLGEDEEKDTPALNKKMGILYSMLRPGIRNRYDHIIEHEDFFNFAIDTLSPYPETYDEVLTATEKIVDRLIEDHQEEMDAMDAAEEELRAKIEAAIDDLINKLAEVSESGADGGEVSAKIGGGGVGAGDDDSYNEDDSLYRIPEGIKKYETIDTGSAEVDKENSVSFIPAKPNEDIYADDVQIVQPYIARVRKHFDFFDYDRTRTDKGLLSGNLDTDKFSEILSGSRTVYQNKVSQKSKNFNIVFLIDESGSMMGENIVLARRSAVLMYEALKTYRSIQTFIYGHTADMNWYEDPSASEAEKQKTNIVVYKEPGKSFEPSMLGSISARANNRDGVAIEQVAKRVRKFSQANTLFIVLSDGAPAALDYQNGVEHTKSVVSRISKQGFYPLQLFIGEYGNKDMFKHFIQLEEYSDLPKQLMKVLRKLTQKIIYS